MDFDRDHLLTDVFEAAVAEIKSDRRKHTPRELTAALEAAEQHVLDSVRNLLQGTIRAKRTALYGMLEEWDQTRTMVKTRWASSTVDDPAWKAK